MTTHRSYRRTARLRVRLVASLLATLGLLFELVASITSASAQIVPLNIQFFDAIGGGTALYSVSPDAVLHSPEGEFVGRAGLTAFGDELKASFADLAFDTTSVETAGSLTIVSFTLTGTNTGSYHGIAANCAGIAVPGVAVLQMNQANPSSDGEFREDSEIVPNRVAEQWISYDADAIASQIAAFNAFDPSSRPGCADHVQFQNDQDAPDPGYEPAPSCSAAAECRLPY